MMKGYEFDNPSASSAKKLETFTNKGWVCHTVALPFTLKISVLRQKKNYENSNTSPCKNI
jgi:hypothetical protein